jgi:hypothetical protein
VPKYEYIEENTSVSNRDDYFVALQAVLDVVKVHSRNQEWEYDPMLAGLDRALDQYSTEEFEGLEEFFEEQGYIETMLEVVEDLHDSYNDGRLFKIFEDSVLSIVIKNYINYDYVVGNPPYVGIKGISNDQKEYYKNLYDSAYGRFDLYVLFMERGLNMLNKDGVLGYITPNKFTRSKYGEKIRKIVSEEYSLSEYVEFGDVDIFEDATNFASILIIDTDRNRTDTNYAKVHKSSEDVFDQIRTHLGEREFITESLEMSTYPTARLSEESWRFVPESAREVRDSIETNSAYLLDDVSLGVRQGISSGGDDAFVVTEEYADKKNLEKEILKPIVRGKDVRRWKVDWRDEYAIYPYDENGNQLAISEYPNVKSHLDGMESYLRDRYCVKESGKGIYDYDGVRPKSVFEGEFKIPTPDMSTENNFAYANEYDCFKNTVYVVTFSADQPYTELMMLGILNSSTSEFIIKQISPPLRGRPFRYRYKTDYVTEIPLPNPDVRIEDVVAELLEIEALEARVDAFPKPYTSDLDSEIMYVEHQWQTGRRSISPECEMKDGVWQISVGITDTIRDPAMDSELRAHYVQEALSGGDYDSGEKTKIPIPKSDSAVRKILDDLESDRDELATTSKTSLENEIDSIVYDLFDLSEDQQQIIEEYVELF